jgi:hypothetical protein
MKIVVCILGAALALATPCRAAEIQQQQPRLVLGAVPQVQSDKLQLGGIVAYDLDRTTRLSSSLSGSGGGGLSADVAASYPDSVLGLDGTSRLRLGADWTHGFSPNPVQSGPLAFGGTAPATDLSVSLSWSHAFTSGLSAGGMAAATRPEGETPGFLLGAGVGYKF